MIDLRTNWTEPGTETFARVTVNTLYCSTLASSLATYLAFSAWSQRDGRAGRWVADTGGPSARPRLARSELPLSLFAWAQTVGTKRWWVTADCATWQLRADL